MLESYPWSVRGGTISRQPGDHTLDKELILLRYASMRRHSIPAYRLLIQGMSLDELLDLYETGELDLSGITEEGAIAAELAASEYINLPEWRPEIILHSPLARAAESAQIWAQALGLPTQIESALSELRPPASILQDVIGREPVTLHLDIRSIIAEAMRLWMSTSMLEELVGSAVDAIQGCESNCLVISHGWLMRGIDAGADLETFLVHPGFAFNEGFDICP